MSLWTKSNSVTIQMKAIEHYFPVVLFIMLYKVESVDVMLKCVIQIKATEQYFPVALFNTPHKVFLTFGSVNVILRSDIQMNATEQHFLLSL